jgi:histidine triad (HIT) family protein
MVNRKPEDIVFEDEQVTVFHDINPQAPVHLLIVPKKHIAKLSDVTEQDSKILCRMMEIAREMAVKMNLNQQGFRLVMNEGKDSGQSIFHMHLHMLSGRRLMWPPG